MSDTHNELKIFAADSAMGIAAAVSAAPSIIVVALMLERAGLDFSVGCATGFIGSALMTAIFAWRRVPLVAAPSPAVALWLVLTESVAFGATLEGIRAASIAAYLVALLTVTLPLNGKKLLPQNLYPPLTASLALMLIVVGLLAGRVLVASPLTVTMFGSLADPFCFVTVLGCVFTLGLAASGIRAALFWGFVGTFLYAYNGGFVVLPETMFVFSGNAASEFMRLDFGELPVLTHIVPTLAIIVILGNVAVIDGLLPGSVLPDERRRSLFTICGGGIIGLIIGALPIFAAPESAALQKVSSPRTATAAAALFFATAGLFAVPVMHELADFAAVFAPLLIVSGCLLIARSPNILCGDMADKATGVMLLVALPLAQDPALGLGTGLLFYVFLKIMHGKRRDLMVGTVLLALLTFMVSFGARF